MAPNREISSYIKGVSLFVLSFVFLVFPVLFLTNTTDAFVFPKQILITIAAVVLAILWAARIFVEKKIALRANPFNLPIVLLGVIILLSAVFSPNRFDSLLQAIPVVMIIVLYFVSINTIDDRKSFNISLSALSLGGVAAALIGIFYSFQVYVLPIPGLTNANFNTLGSPIQLILYLLPLLLLSSFYVFNGFKGGSLHKKFDIGSSWGLYIQAIASVLIVVGIGAILFRMVNSPKPIFLPFQEGFQIALASVSRDSGRQIPAAFFGSGYGTFLTDFTRFKLPSFNLNETLWNIPFSFSSSYFLELMATTGILGALAFIFLIIKVIKTRIYPINPLYSALVLLFILSFLVPFSFSVVFLLFILIAFYSAFLAIERDKRVDLVTVSLVALKEGLISVNEADHTTTKRRHTSIVLPAIVSIVIILLAGYVGYYTVKIVSSDVTFAQSLSQEALKNGQKTYELQRAAIATFPYKSDYYRVFSRVNLALANSLASSVPQGSSPSAQTQQQVTQLLQQSINSGRSAVNIAPASSVNWENLAQIYRSLINIGENAPDFAVASLNQAIALDPSNPQLYIQMGGIFYQLGQFDLAQNQFQVAVNLKPDFANARYNLGHAFEEKGELTAALQQYQIVKQLVANDKNSVTQIDKEIAALQEKIGKAQTQQGEQGSVQPNEGPQPLEIATPSAQLPAQTGKVELPAPPAGRRLTPTPSLTPDESPTPTVAN